MLLLISFKVYKPQDCREGHNVKAHCPVSVDITLNISIPSNIKKLPPFAAANNLALIKYSLVASISPAGVIGIKVEGGGGFYT